MMSTFRLYLGLLFFGVFLAGCDQPLIDIHIDGTRWTNQGSGGTCFYPCIGGGGKIGGNIADPDTGAEILKIEEGQIIYTLRDTTTDATFRIVREKKIDGANEKATIKIKKDDKGKLDIETDNDGKAILIKSTS